MNKYTLKIFIICLTLLLVAAAQPALGSGWAQFHMNAQHTGYSDSTAPDTNFTAWISEDIGAQPSSSLVVADGLIYVNCGNENVTALNMYTGKNEGLKVNGPGDNGLDSWASPCYYNGSIYRARTDACNGGPMAADGKIFQSDWDGNHYYCYNESGYNHGEDTSNEFWNFTVSGYAQGTPAYYDGEVYLTSWGYAYNGSGNGHVYCVYVNNGTQKWHKDIPLDCCGSASLNTSSGILYVTTYNFGSDGDLYALYMDNGTEYWNRSIMRTDSTPAIDDNGYIYVCGGCRGYSDMMTYCFAPNGTKMWNTTASDQIGDWTCSVAVADGKVFVGKPTTEWGPWGAPYYAMGCDGTYALNASNGNIIWSYEGGGCSPIVADGMIFTIGDDGKVYAFGKKTYDFTVGAGTDHFAYEGEVSSVNPSSSTVPNGNIAAYSNIESDNEVREVFTTSNTGKYAAQRFVFSIDSNMQQWIDTINVTWNGKAYHDSAGDGAYLYIWNGTGYENLDDNSVDTDGTLTGEVTSGISNYINSDKVTVLIVQKNAQTSDLFNTYQSHIETDYVKLVATP
ncbi:cell surface protein [Methanosarcina siciliae T4/M]|uniref:Cell surface protein n=1 Tax=Methanosarcina siciliae T4/M TaxID=1434120 RepID=A0A0E3P8S5_9EURY|nr:PQQ-binding-like beta-propeller repeat protein [Methanosarcina siciliae]AKB30304.1 cell surface protein [Methanosarcina siciliae T4/M]